MTARADNELNNRAHQAMERIAPQLRPEVERAWEATTAASGWEGLAVHFDSALLDALFAVWSQSPFVARACARQPALLSELLEHGDLLTDYGPQEHLAKLRIRLRGVVDAAQLGTTLRRFRNREMVRIAFRDLAGWACLNETMDELSRLADACLDESVRLLQLWASGEYGQPRGADRAPQQLVIIGMGKLGARELNFSSDIDLIFAYPEPGHTDGAHTLDNEEFFIRLGRKLIDVMSTVSEHGFVFRMDMRLRPFGDSGPLAMSFEAMENYYLTHAREWERYAMVKARAVAGDVALGQSLLETLRPFVYRRYLDYGAFEALREMKLLISQQLTRKGMGDNIKLGPGGIREVEFIGQAFQLIRGGREPELQERRILTVLERLGERDYLPRDATLELAAAYRFLRRTENHLQAMADRQGHILPENELDRSRLAGSMGYADWTGFFTALQRHRECVQGHFENVFALSEADAAETDKGLGAVWQGALVGDEALDMLREAGYDDPEPALKRLQSLRASRACRSLSRQGRARLDRLLPLLLRSVAESPAAGETLQRLLGVIEAVIRRTSYIALLADSPTALQQLVRLGCASPWIVRLLSRYPLLLDELLDARRLYAPLNRGGLEEELGVLMHDVASEDLEQQMERLRQFAHSNGLRVAAADVTGALPIMKVSDHLTAVAEVVLERVLRMAWQQMVSRHGTPTCVQDGHRRVPGFAVIAYGKLGGIELGYGSDLDLVFIHDSAGESQWTDGERRLDNAVFFVRVGHRIIHLLGTQTMSGILYEVDMRLRPSGNSGLLVASLDSFTSYQQERAWTWEHQALVRARGVAGDEGIAARFAQVRKRILCKPRNPEEVVREVAAMRERMRAELGNRNADLFDLKQDPGGIADIEFMVQYGVLRWASDYPELVHYTDNIRILDSLAEVGVMSRDDRDLLNEAYRTYRAAVHRATLQDKGARVTVGEFSELRAAVQGVWARWMGTPAGSG